VVQLKQPETAEADNSDDLGAKIILWRTSDSTSTILWTGSDSVVTSVAFSADGQKLAWGNADKPQGVSNEKGNTEVVLWNGQEPEVLPCWDKVNPCRDKVTSLAFNNKGNLLAMGLETGKTVLWDLAKNRAVEDKPLQGEGRVTDLAFGPDGTILAAVTNKKLRHPQPGVITLWDVESQEKIGNKLVGHDGTISGIAFNADGNILASASKDDESVGTNFEGEHYVNLWDLDIKNAGGRFCKIVVCEPLPAEVAGQINNKSWFQSLYEKSQLLYEKVFG
jgi:WD40 repeat protein